MPSVKRGNIKKLGVYLDSKDERDMWCEAVATHVNRTNNTFHVHFVGFSDRYNRWQTLDGLAPFHRHSGSVQCEEDLLIHGKVNRNKTLESSRPVWNGSKSLLKDYNEYIDEWSEEKNKRFKGKKAGAIRASKDDEKEPPKQKNPTQVAKAAQDEENRPPKQINRKKEQKADENKTPRRSTRKNESKDDENEPPKSKNITKIVSDDKDKPSKPKKLAQDTRVENAQPKSNNNRKKGTRQSRHEEINLSEVTRDEELVAPTTRKKAVRAIYPPECDRPKPSEVARDEVIDISDDGKATPSQDPESDISSSPPPKPSPGDPTALFHATNGDVESIDIVHKDGFECGAAELRQQNLQRLSSAKALLLSSIAEFRVMMSK